MNAVPSSSPPRSSKGQESISGLSEVETATSEPWSQLSYGTPTPCSQLDYTLGDTHDIVSCLLRHLPSLQDPEPHDVRDYDQHDGADHADQSHVKTKFPRAAQHLVQKLGTTNWKRRQQLMKLHASRIHTAVDCLEADEAASRGEQSQGRKHSIFGDAADSKSGFLTVYSESNRPSIFSGPNSTVGTLPTAFSDAASPKVLGNQAPANDTHRLKIPRPPEPGASYNGHQFKCPYCSHDLVEVCSSSDWK